MTDMNNVKYHQRNIFGDSRGWTFVEVILAIFISSIVMGGIVLAFTDAMREWSRASQRLVMFEEGTQTMDLIQRHIRSAIKIEEPRSYGGNSYAFLRLQFVNRDDIDGRYKISEFFYSGTDNSVRYNGNSLKDEGGGWISNKRLLPSIYPPTEPGEDQYIAVKRLKFTVPEEYRPTNPINPQIGIVRVEMTLESPKGDTLYLSSLMAKRNS